MNGVLILSLDSGMLLFSEYFTKGFGLDDSNATVDPLQLSALIFTLYKTSVQISCIPKVDQFNASDQGPENNSALTHFTQGRCTLHFMEGRCKDLHYLMVLSMDASFDNSFGRECSTRLSTIFTTDLLTATATAMTEEGGGSGGGGSDTSISVSVQQHFQKNRGKIVKQFRSQLLVVMEQILTELAGEVSSVTVPGLLWMSVCLPEPMSMSMSKLIPGYMTDEQLQVWCSDQWNNNRQGEGDGDTPHATPSSTNGSGGGGKLGYLQGLMKQGWSKGNVVITSNGNSNSNSNSKLPKLQSTTTKTSSSTATATTGKFPSPRNATLSGNSTSPNTNTSPSTPTSLFVPSIAISTSTPSFRHIHMKSNNNNNNNNSNYNYNSCNSCKTVNVNTTDNVNVKESEEEDISVPVALQQLVTQLHNHNHTGGDASKPTATTASTTSVSNSVPPFHVLETHGVVLVWLCRQTNTNTHPDTDKGNGNGNGSGTNKRYSDDPGDCRCCVTTGLASHTALGKFCVWSRVLLLLTCQSQSSTEKVQS